MPYEINSLTPEPTPTIAQLLAFYLEAGVDCALSEQPVNRLSDPEWHGDVKAAAASPDVNAAQSARPAAAAFAAPAAEAPPSPDAAIATAREAARTAASLEILRDMLEKFDG